MQLVGFHPWWLPRLSFFFVVVFPFILVMQYDLPHFSCASEVQLEVQFQPINQSINLSGLFVSVIHTTKHPLKKKKKKKKKKKNNLLKKNK